MLRRGDGRWGVLPKGQSPTNSGNTEAVRRRLEVMGPGRKPGQL